ncbi:hypothetical protein [Paramagnetospirillum magneticum]|uniref:Uncharacterized protein n=1 Tax=Paramagnetospirillum magneticum (strain ATCC 700264 / AMB-1) TaxID=342108 RepID=Q2W7B5_PARM1|nr:hypothetical protein [Paramagnetospirillum magneticum]BAE50260.1 hypothetical protein amb1456 [Paramagnetospirillum magneticum AMB-1]
MSGGAPPLRFAGRTADENLAHAIEAVKLRVLPSGALDFAKPPSRSEWYLLVRSAPDLRCQEYNAFLFRHAYAGTTVPRGCGECYKIKIVPPDLRALVALRSLLESLTGPCKCGVDFYNPHSRDFYAGFFYYDGLNAARADYPALRAAIDAQPHLGPDVPMIIKRGCSNYEAACGPSDRWTFPEGMAELEAGLRARFQPTIPAPADYRLRRMTAMVHWIKFAYWIKDDSYLDFTGGKPLHPPTVGYSPDT